ncbi:MAG TPA: metal-dependent hydrolase, partial [Clostridia bacterium]|nr:metal-dependent hydrolase [Clostridia bacterium]
YALDVALLPIGDNYVMGPEDAQKGAELLKPRIVVPMHYNTFDLIRQDANAFKKEVESKTTSQCIILGPGQSLEI